MQDGKLFSESVLTNIVLEDEHIDYEQLQRCCEIAQIADEINAMPKGFDTMVGENGRGLSGGQKQRLLITRALYRNPQMLFLDEATNAFDTVNEARITKALNEAFTDRTVVVVAHRLSTIRNADQIVVMHQGEIVEVGTHEELIQAGRYYTELVASQSDKVFKKKITYESSIPFLLQSLRYPILVWYIISYVF